LDPSGFRSAAMVQRATVTGICSARMLRRR
jgi:hypothetical protein